MTHTNNPLVLRQSTNFPNGKATPVTFDENSQNFSNCMRWAGNWADPLPNTYAKNQVVRHEGGTWVALQDTAVEPNWQVSQTDWSPLSAMGRGGLTLSIQGTSGSDITAIWTKVNIFDAEAFPINYGFTSDIPNDQWSYQHEGIWLENITLGFGHDISQNGRNFQLRLWNVTDGVQEGQSVLVGVGRNQDATLVSLTLAVVIGPTDLNKTYELQLGGGDTISSIVWTSAWVTAVQVSIF